MKSFLIALLSLSVVSCVSNSKHGSEPARSSAASSAHEVDMSAMVGKEVNAQVFLKECVAQTGMNITYDSNMAKALEHTFIRWSNRERLPTHEFESLVGQLLSASGFELSSIGPPELRVFSVKRLER